MTPSYREELERLRKHYDARVATHGDSPAAVQWSDRATQERRMAVLAEVGPLRDAKVLDFGCGTGHLLAYLREHCGFAGEYVGYDLSKAMVRLAQGKYPDIRFEIRDILAEGVPESFDYVLMNGVFNNRVGDNRGLMKALLKALFVKTRQALAFNALSRYVDRMNPELAYYAPEEVFAFCKRTLSPCVTLRHDYQVRPGVVPYEFTVYVYASEESCRAPLECLPAE